jgi:hypothetical protein
LDKRIPLSIAQWHQHVNFCFPPKERASEMFAPNPRFGMLGLITTEAECDAAGGRFFPRLFGWMVHVYPDETDPKNVWSVERQMPPEPHNHPSNGRRGHIIYINQGTLYAIPFDPERLEILGTAQPVVNGIFSNSVSGLGRFDLSSRPSPSGKFIYREGASVDESKWAILWVDAAGRTTPLVATPGNFRDFRLSPDGRRLAIIATTEKGSDLFVYDTTLDKMSPPLTLNGEAVGSPVWAPDGKHLAFRSKDGMAWIRADGGGDVQLLLPGQSTPSSFSPDGRITLRHDDVSTPGVAYPDKCF